MPSCESDETLSRWLRSEFRQLPYCYCPRDIGRDSASCDYQREARYLRREGQQSLSFVPIRLEHRLCVVKYRSNWPLRCTGLQDTRSEEHTSELQSHSFTSYAVFCL